MDTEAPDRRDSILRAAGEIFFERGFSATTTADIAQRARTSKRTLYQHFASKHEILAELIRTESREMSAPVQLAGPSSHAELLATLEAFGQGFLERLLDHRTVALYRLAITEGGGSTAVGLALRQNGEDVVRKTIGGFLKAAAANGLVPHGEIETSAYVYFSVLGGGWSLIAHLLHQETPVTAPERRRRARLATEAFDAFVRSRGR